MPSNIQQGKTYQLIFSINLISDRAACAISDPDNEVVIITGDMIMMMMMIIMIITGGWHTMTTVSVYSEAGHQGDLVMMMMI